MSNNQKTKDSGFKPEPSNREQFNNGYRPPSSESRPAPPTKPPSSSKG
jgi:hypothetical protein